MASSTVSSFLISDLTRLAMALHCDRPLSATWASFETLMCHQFGYKLLTILFFAPTRGVTRVFSNRPDIHPIGTRENSGSTPPPSRDAWVQRVLVDGETWRGSTKDDLKDVFEDWELLWNEGLGSVLNIPIRLHGVTIGSINTLDAEHAYDDDFNLDIAILVAHLIASSVKKEGEEMLARSGR